MNKKQKILKPSTLLISTFTISAILMSILIGYIIYYIALSISAEKQTFKNTVIEEEYYITYIEGNSYYGESINSGNKINFTSDYVNSDVTIGTNVIAYFDNTFDNSLISVQVK